MADKKISALTDATTPLAGTEVLPIVQGGSTVKVSIADVTAGRAVTASSFTVGTTAVYGISFPISGAVGFPKQTVGPSYPFAFDHEAAAYGQMRLMSSNTSTNTLNKIIMTFNQGGDVAVSAGNLVIGTAGKGIDFSANGGDVLTQYDEGTWTPNQGSGLTVVGAFSSNGRYTRVGRLVTVSGTVTGATSIAVSAIGQICDNLPFTKAGASISTGTGFSSSLTTSGVAAAGGAILYSLVALSGGTDIAFALTYEVA
jgi:hypothetical protein